MKNDTYHFIALGRWASRNFLDHFHKYHIFWVHSNRIMEDDGVRSYILNIDISSYLIIIHFILNQTPEGIFPRREDR